MPLQRAHVIARAGAPHAHCIVLAHARQPPVPQLRQRSHRPLVPLQRVHALARAGVPHAHGFVTARAGQLPVTQLHQRGHPICVPLQCAHALARAGVPNAHGVVFACACQPPVPQLHQRVHLRHMPQERQLQRARSSQACPQRPQPISASPVPRFVKQPRQLATVALLKPPAQLSRQRCGRIVAAQPRRGQAQRCQQQPHRFVARCVRRSHVREQCRQAALAQRRLQPRQAQEQRARVRGAPRLTQVREAVQQPVRPGRRLP